jgi:ribosomal protein S19
LLKNHIIILSEKQHNHNMSETTNVTKQFLDKDGLDALWNKICSVFASKQELEDLGNNISVIDEKVKNEAIIDTTNPYFLLGQSAQNTTSKAGTDANCYIKEGFIYSNSTKVLTEANLEDTEPVQRNDNTWSNVKLDTDGFMGVDVPTIPTSLKNPHSLTIQGNGTTIDSYDGSSAKTINITPDNIGAAPTSHKHSKSEITDFPTSLKNPYSLTIQGNGVTLTNGVYNGSASKTVNITPVSIGAASISDIPTIPESLKNPNALTIQANGTTIDSYDGSSAKTINITPASLGLSIIFDYKGVTTSNISDGSTTKPILIGGSNYTQKPGDVVIVNGDTDKEYFWNGTIWEEIGRTIDLSGYATMSQLQDYLLLSGGTLTGQLNSRSIVPTSTNTYSLGTDSLKWSNVYATNFIGNIGWDYIKNKPNFATVATSGSYNDLSDKPTIPTVYNGKLTIKQNGTSVGTFTANQSGNVTIELTDTNTDTQSDWNETTTTSAAYIKNKPTIPVVNIITTDMITNVWNEVWN